MASEERHATSVCQGLSSLASGGGKSRDPAREVGTYTGKKANTFKAITLKFKMCLFSDEACFPVLLSVCALLTS